MQQLLVTLCLQRHLGRVCLQWRLMVPVLLLTVCLQRQWQQQWQQEGVQQGSGALGGGTCTGPSHRPYHLGPRLQQLQPTWRDMCLGKRKVRLQAGWNTSKVLCWQQ